MARFGKSVRVRTPQRRIRRQQPLPEQTGAARSLRPLIAEPDRQRILYRPGPDAVLSPQLAEATHCAIRAPVSRGHGRVEQRELRHPVPRAETQLEAAVGHQVDQRTLLGDFGWMMQRGDQYRGPEPDASGSGGDRGRERQGCAEIVVFEEMVLGEPGRARAQSLRLLARLQGESIEARRTLPPLRRIAQVKIDAGFHPASVTAASA